MPSLIARKKKKEHFEEDTQGILKSSHLHNIKSICMFVVYTILPSRTQIHKPYTWKINKSRNTHTSHTTALRGTPFKNIETYCLLYGTQGEGL
jgi:hypothetical protein